MENLLPCPFCGTPDPEMSDIEFTAEIQCSGNDCNARVSAMLEDDAVKLWNRRPTQRASDGAESLAFYRVCKKCLEINCDGSCETPRQ